LRNGDYSKWAYRSIRGHDRKLGGLFKGRGKDRKKKKLYHKVKEENFHIQKKINNATAGKEASKWLIVGAS